MSSTTRHSLDEQDSRHRLTVRGAVHGEFVKLLSLRSIVVTMLMVAPLIVGFTVLDISGKTDLIGGDASGNLDLAMIAAGSGVPIAYLLIVITAVLAITSEYATGQIAVTHTIAPRRGLTVLAKSVVLASIVWAIGLVSMLVAGGASVSVAAAAGALPEGEIVPRLLQTSLGGATAMTGIGVIALCIGGVLRSPAFAIAAAFCLLLVLPGLVALAPVQWVTELWWVLPEAGARALFQVDTGRSVLEGATVLGASMVVGLLAWVWTMLRR